MGCFPHVSVTARGLHQSLEHLVRVASFYEDRGRTEFTARIAAQAVSSARYTLQTTCSQQQVLAIREDVRNRLDAVRNAFRASPVLPRQPQAFDAFRNMVTHWEAFRDAVSDS